MSMKGPSHAWDISSSPFSSVIGTNHVPSSAELDQLKNLLVEPQHGLTRLQLEISRLQSVLDALLREKNEVETYIEAHRALMSPVRRIPSETLGEIFIHCLPSDTHPFQGVRDVKQAPLLMTTICRHWRRVAIDTPRLWNIHFPGFHLSEEVASRRTTGLDLWLERAATLPISVSFHGSSKHIGFLPDEILDGVAEANRQLRASKNMTFFLQSLQRFNDRFHSLRLCLSPVDFRMLLSLLQPSTSFLAIVSLRLGNYGYSADRELSDIYLELFKARMPALRSLQFNDGSQFWPAQIPTRGWPMNMSSLQCFPPSFLYSLAMQNPHLQSLQIGLHLDIEDEIVLPTVTLTKLTSLSLDLQTVYRPGETTQMNDRIPVVFSLLDFPSLNSLSVRYDTLRHSMTRNPFHGMSLNNLEILCLHCPLAPEVLTDCLQSVPNLASLYFFDIGHCVGYRCISTTLQDIHLSRLGLATGNPSSLCSRLRHIQMIYGSSSSHSSGESWSAIALADFLEARVKSKALDSFDLYSYRPMRSFLEAQLGRFVRLKEEWGLKLRLRQVRRPSRSVDDLPTTGLQCDLWPSSTDTDNDIIVG